VTYTEDARLRAEQAAMAQDQAATARRRSEARVTHPEFDAEADQRRSWALARARQTGVGHRIGGEPRLVYWRNADGSDNLRVDPSNPNRTLATTTYGPPVIVEPARIWTDQEEEELRRRQREAQNALLAAHYDLAELVEARILTEAEAAHPAVQAAAAARARRAAESSIPYRLEESVR
jgi:hypothetical protein